MGFRVCGLGFGVQGLGIRVWGLGIRVLGFRDSTPVIENPLEKNMEDAMQTGTIDL